MFELRSRIILGFVSMVEHVECSTHEFTGCLNWGLG